jgi:hypothetical protein
MALRDERGGIVKWLIGLVILGVVLFDAGSIIVNIFSLDSTADQIANEVSNVSRLDAINNPTILEQRAAALAKDEHSKLATFSVGTDGIIRLTLKRRAHTLIVGRIGAIKDWAKATGSGRAATD